MNISFSLIRLYKFILLLSVLVFFKDISIAQTCTGSIGDPIVNISFGSGPNFGPQLSAGTTSSLQYQASVCPGDGFYSIVNYTSGCWPNDVVWHSASDHTGNSEGYYMLINASNQPSNFYIQTINGLCEGTTYQFAAWLLDMCSVKGILPNITFTIEKTDGTILGDYNTGDIPILNPVTWKQYGFFFTTPPGVSTVVLRMRNNALGGVGNDLGLDDITFRPAGPEIKTGIQNFNSTTINVCDYDKGDFNLTASVENCYATTAYQWQLSVDSGLNWTNITGATDTIYTRKPTTAGIYQYRLTAAQSSNINVSSCRVASLPVTIRVNPRPAITITNSGPVCENDSMSLKSSGGAVYTWSGPNGFTSNNPSISFSNIKINEAGKYRLMVQSSAGCFAIDSTIITVNPTPQANFSIAGSTCENNLLTFIDNSIPNGLPLVKWSWDFGDNSIASVSSPTHLYTQAGSYPVSLTIENNKGCKSNVFIKNVDVHYLPKPWFGVPGICLSDAIATFSDSSAINDNSQLQFKYLWNFADANASAVNPNSSTQKNGVHTYSQVGVYPVKLTVTSKDGCKADSTRNFTVNGSKPIAGFMIDSAFDFCSNNELMITDQSSVDFGTITKVAIYWDYKNTPALFTPDTIPSTGKKYFHRYPAFGVPVSKSISIRYVVYSGISCVNEITKQFTLKGSPKINFDTLASVCEDAVAFKITGAKELSGIAGTGIFSGAGIQAGGILNPKLATPGLHLINYTFSSTNGCAASANQQIVIYPQPTVNAGPDRMILSGGFTTLTATASGNNLQFKWTPDSSISDTKILSPTVSPLHDIVYNLKVISTDGCIANDQVTVSVLPDIFIPSAFSPNGDGINDTWRIPFLDSYPGAKLQVFNRYGEMVYLYGTNVTAWDGKYKGKSLPSGTYTWMLQPGAGKRLMHGTVTIVR